MSVPMNIVRQPVIQRGNLIIDPQCYTVTLAGDKIDLYQKEFDVLCLLAQYPDWVLSHGQIYGAIWQEDTLGCESIIYNTICQIRKKTKRPEIIRTVVGRGYKFEI